MVSPHRGSAVFPAEAHGLSEAERTALEAAVGTVRSRADAWAHTPVGQRIALLEEVARDCAGIAGQWVEASTRGKRIAPTDRLGIGQDWVSGPYITVRYLRRLSQSLTDIQSHGHPRIPRHLTEDADGRLVAEVLPRSAYDRIFFRGVSGAVVMKPGVTKEQLPELLGSSYRRAARGRVALVLGAGNVSGMPVVDALNKLFVENEAVVVKLNPVNDYMKPLLENGLRALVERGVVRFVTGGPDAGAYLCDRGEIDEIHITGSDKTYDAVVYGPGRGGARRAARRTPARSKPVTAELGGVGPVIVVPGRWSQSDLRYGAEMMCAMAFDGAGFSCTAADVIVQHAAWSQRQDFLDAVGAVARSMPLRAAYYPGAHERHRRFLEAHPEAQTFGSPTDDELPWTLIPGVDWRDRDEICFTLEPFCSVCSETPIPAPDVAGFLDRAVDFVNTSLWGTLTCVLLGPRRCMAEPTVSDAVERAVRNLRYGTVAVNYHPGAAWVAGTLPWGGFQHDTVEPSESGIGFGMNALMIAQAQKSVVRAGFPLFPRPVWFPSRGRAACETFRRLVRFEARPSVRQVPGIMWSGIAT